MIMQYAGINKWVEQAWRAPPFWLLGQVAHLYPAAEPARRGGGATAAAGLGGATGGQAFGQTAGMYSNVGGDANQAITGAGDGLRFPGVGRGAAAAAAAGFPPPQRTHLTPIAPPRGAPAPPMGGAPIGPVVPVLEEIITGVSL